MDSQELIFAKPVKVIQVFRHINIYDKKAKSFDQRIMANTWNSIRSKWGHVLDGKLYLSENILIKESFKSCELIMITDDNHHYTHNIDQLDPVQYFDLPQSTPFGIFEIKPKDKLELHLVYDHFKIGIPARDPFKLCDLKENHPVEIKINGKIDFSLTSRRDRMYKEQVYIFNFLGDFNSCFISPIPMEGIIKNIPEKRKVIDLMKPLW